MHFPHLKMKCIVITFDFAFPPLLMFSNINHESLLLCIAVITMLMIKRIKSLFLLLLTLNSHISGHYSAE